ncbi:hypothetical protein J6590_059194 [Homalodisca vitripennis]|nr:hypothetical protein J6590_059194 [Homalodisca vitripennis]
MSPPRFPRSDTRKYSTAVSSTIYHAKCARITRVENTTASSLATGEGMAGTDTWTLPSTGTICVPLAAMLPHHRAAYHTDPDAPLTSHTQLPLPLSIDLDQRGTPTNNSA